MPVSELIGEMVTNHDREKLGLLADMMIDAERGTVTFVVLNFEGKKFMLPFHDLEVNPQTGEVCTPLAREVLERTAVSVKP